MLLLARWHGNERMSASERRNDCRLRARIPCELPAGFLSRHFFAVFPNVSEVLIDYSNYRKQI